MEKIILYFITLTILVACGGGGGGSGGNGENIIPDINTSLSPLQLNTLDLSNNPIQYIDISKIGVHTLYKLKFTNTNSVEVNLRSLVGYTSTDAYYSAMAQEQGIPLDSYYAENNPGRAYGIYVKTSNTDDCLNQMQQGANGIFFTPLLPQKSCVYYTYATNTGTNFTTHDSFTQPVSYFIYTNPISTGQYFSLNVVQCTQLGSTSDPVYDCSNMSKPGFSGQFIAYKMLPINGVSNFMPFNAFGAALSKNGNWFWSCTTSVCSKFALNYNNSNNTLTQTMTPSSTINIINSGTNMNTIYPSIDGSNVWVSRYDNNAGFSLVNTSKPNKLLTECGSVPCVPNINTSSNLGINGVIGLDGSFWWQTGVGADIYDPIAQTFVQSNIPGVVGVNPDGTVIGFSNGQPGCWVAGSSYTSYVYRGPLLNYTAPDIGTNAQSDGQNVYMLMPVQGILGSNLTAYYKVHTENGLCEINLSDYTYWVSDTSSYSFSTSILNSAGPFFVTSISNIYTGL